MGHKRVVPKPPNGFVSSAVRLPAFSSRMAGRSETWQGQAWCYYDEVAELRFVSTWVGNTMKRAILRVGQRENDMIVPLQNGPAVDVLEAYFGGFQGQQEMLSATGVDLTVAGDCYHVGRSTGDGYDWYVLTPGKVTTTGKGSNQRITADWGDGKVELGSEDLVIRIWQPHPINPYLADSPVRSNLQTLAEIKTLNDHVQAQLTSRLAGAGVLFMPSEIQFPNPVDQDPAASQADAFMTVLGEAMMTPIRDRGNASAVVPIVVTAPGESLDKVQHLTFWTELDDAAIAMREAAVKKLAIGLDTPPEVLLGLSDSNHWSGWLTEETGIKSHLEPRLSLVAHAITTSYLRPALDGLVGNPEDFYVIADTSAIRLRPNRSKEAIELWDRGELSGEALRRETGFPESDAPGQVENREWLLRKIALGSTSPEQTGAALDLLGAPLGLSLTGPDNKNVPDHMRPRRSLENHPDRNPPDRGESERQGEEPARQPAALLAACELLVLRACERAGNRMCDGKPMSHTLRKVPAHQRYLHDSVTNPDRLLKDAWVTVPQALTGLSEDAKDIADTLDFYVRGLLANRLPYNRDTLDRLLQSGVRVDVRP